MGGEAGCKQLAAEFYARVGKDPALRKLFPGKSLRCATEAFTSFLIQFLGGDEAQTQDRWFVSLRESHARFRISQAERAAWLKNMRATLEAIPFDQATRKALGQFFQNSSSYVIGNEAADPDDGELAVRWRSQRVLDDVIAAVAAGHDHEALALGPQVASRPSVFVGLLARMLECGRADLVRFVVQSVERDPSLAARRYFGKTLLHFASGAGCPEVVALLLRLSVDPDTLDRGGHTPLYCVANQCSGEAGPGIVRTLVKAGGDVNACGGVTRATPLHMAARRGHLEIARALLACGANVEARDSRGVTPVQRAITCRRHEVAGLLVERGAKAAALR